jgi:hypothetical protein
MKRSAGQNVKKFDPSLIAAGIVKWYRFLGKHFDHERMKI